LIDCPKVRPVIDHPYSIKRSERSEAHPYSIKNIGPKFLEESDRNC